MDVNLSWPGAAAKTQLSYFFNGYTSLLYSIAGGFFQSAPRAAFRTSLARLWPFAFSRCQVEVAVYTRFRKTVPDGTGRASARRGFDSFLQQFQVQENASE
jgi:hypothetical protein